MARKFIWRDRLGAGRAPAEGHRGGRGLDRAAGSWSSQAPDPEEEAVPGAEPHRAVPRTAPST